MFKQHIKTSFRNLWKNKSFSLINILGLSLGLASVMTLGLLVHQYLTTDDIEINKARMYYLKTYNADGSSYTATTFPLLYEIEKAAPEVEAATHMQGWNEPWLKYGDKETQENTKYVDTGFFKVFSLPLSQGNPAIALSEKFSVVISQKVATELFGYQPALGKTIMADDSIPLTVTGVLSPLPANSSIKVDVLLPMAILSTNKDFVNGANWYNTFADNYLLLKKGADPKTLDNKIKQVIKQFYVEEHKKAVVKTVPFADIKEEAGANIKAIITGAVAASIFILLIIVVNLLNLNAATMLSRTKEVAVRQMIGSGKLSIAAQFCLENALIIFSSLILGFLFFLNFLLPKVDEITNSGFEEVSFKWFHDYPVIIVFTITAFIIILIAGTYPALRLTSVKVADAVKGNMSSRQNKGFIRSFFITIQFTLAIILICVSIVLNSQINYMKSASLGFEKDNVVVAKLDLAFKDEKLAATQFDVIINALKNNPYIRSFSTSQVIPTAYDENYNEYFDVESNKKISLRQVGTDAGYTTTFKIPIIAGRNFNNDLAATEGKNILLNRTAVKAFGWTKPIGKHIKGSGGDDTYTVVGVMEDFHYSDLQQPIGPLIQWYSGKQGLQNNRYLSVHFAAGHSKDISSMVENEFKKLPSRRSFTFHFMNELVDNQYALLTGILKITNYIALLTIGIACMGMFGLVALFAQRRVKEIGVRKVLGASVLNITSLLSKDFIKLVAIAVVVASPIAWWLMTKWLLDFSYRIDIRWWMFALAGVVAILIAVVTVSFQAIKAALVNPVTSLRTE